MSHIPTSGAVTIARQRLKPLLEAVASGDVEAFKAALFSGVPGVVSPLMARDLHIGFASDKRSVFRSGGMSLAEFCYRHGRAEMLRIAFEARHPDMVNGFITGPAASWSRHLCTAFGNNRFSMLSLPALALSFGELQNSLDFLDLGLEFDPENEGAEALEANDSTAAALIRASRMRTQLKVIAAREGAPEVPPSAPPARRRRVV